MYIVVCYFKLRIFGCFLYGDVFIICVLREVIDDKKVIFEGNMKLIIYLFILNNY